MNKELEQFDINIDDIKENNNLFENINEAIEKMKLHTLSNRFEVVLNNNLIESKEKLTNYRTILGCRISYDNLDKNISFIVREDTKPTYEELEQKLDKYKEVIDKIKEYITSYESIDTIQQIETPENNAGLDEDTFVEMVRRYMIVHDKILELLEEIE